MLLMGVRFIHLRADFPNYTYWADDHAKFSDEGWYANAAMNSVLLGHWYLPGDWAPATVVPAWPALLTAEFHLTGVSVVAARATEAVFSCLSLLLAMLIFRRFYSLGATLALGILIAASASGYIYSRVAILESPFEFTILLCLWLALRLRRASILDAILLGCAIVLMVLTKTTGVFLLPAILYPIWFMNRENWKLIVRPILTVLFTVGILIAVERIFFANHHLADARAFFGNSEPPGIVPFATGRKFVRLLYRGSWIDPILWPVACVALLASLWIRDLWRQILWGVCALWIAGYAAFIVYHFDGPPRYFTVMSMPTLMIVVIFAAQLQRTGHSTIAKLVAATAVISVAWNLWQVQRYVLHPEYTMAHAADRIRNIIDTHPEVPRLIIGHASNQTTLYIGVPSMDDMLGSASESQKMQMYNPGWALIWSDEPVQDLNDIAQTRVLVPMANIQVMDDPIRNHLELFELLPKTSR